MDGYRLGVDFGTSNTVAVLRWPDGHVRPLLFDGSPLLPSAVFADPAGGLLVGRDAVHAARVAPGSFEPHPKRRVDEGTVLLGAAETAVTDLFAAVLGRVVAEVDRVASARPSTVVLTHPASWGPRRRDLLAAAAAAAGMGEVRLVPEPVAAAAYLVRMAGERVRVGAHAVVSDLGATEQPELVVAEGSLHAVPDNEPQPIEAPPREAAPVSAPVSASMPPPVAAAGSGRWRLALAVAAVLAVANVLLVVVLKPGDEEPGGGPSTARSTAADRFTLGFAQVGSESTWREANTRSVQEAAAAANVELVYANAAMEHRNQVEAVRSFIARRVDVIAFAPVVTAGWDEVLGEAKAAGIPVIVLEREVVVSDVSFYRSVLASDFVAEGRKAGDWVVRTFATDGAAIAELQGTRGSGVTTGRSGGFNDAILADSRLRIAARQSGDFTRSGGQAAMRSILATHADIDVVFAHNDDMALGAIQAIVAAGRTPGTDIRIVSIDGVRDAMNELVAGRINFIVECSPHVGPQLMGLARRVHNGDRVPRRVSVEETAFDQNQARQALPTRTY